MLLVKDPLEPIRTTLHPNPGPTILPNALTLVITMLLLFQVMEISGSWEDSMEDLEER